MAANNLLTTALVGALLPKAVPEGAHGPRVARLLVRPGPRRGGDARRRLDVRLFRSVFDWTAEFCRSDLSQLAYRFRSSRDAKPWKAVQRAALETLRQAPQDKPRP